MPGIKRYILSTRPLPKNLREEAAALNIEIEEMSFIETKAIQEEQTIQKIKELADEKRTVVFTSMNAVEAVGAQVSKTPDWRIYSIGHTTKKLIEEKWGASVLAGDADNAQRLGERLIDDDVKEVVFFCGNIRRDELPNKIRSEGGTVEEVVVYETVETPAQISRHYDGILFFSPSAVTSFFKVNKIDRTTELFAIGKTTAETLRQFAHKKIIVANATGKQELARLAIDYFTDLDSLKP